MKGRTYIQSSDAALRTNTFLAFLHCLLPIIFLISSTNGTMKLSYSRLFLRDKLNIQILNAQLPLQT